VVRASYPSILDVSVFQGRAAVGTVKPQDPQLTLRVPEKNQLFAQDLDGLGDIVEISCGSYYEPIAPKPFSRGSPWPHMSQDA
jgi:hypothetical protein